MQPFRTILFAADFSKNSVEAFRVAQSLAVENVTRLFVLHVETKRVPAPGGEGGVDATPGVRDAACHEPTRQQMHDVYAPFHPIDVEYRVKEGEPAQEILRMADEVEADMIVMGTHGLSPMHRLLTGSVAAAVLGRQVSGHRC